MVSSSENQNSIAFYSTYLDTAFSISCIIFSCCFISCVYRTCILCISAFMALISPWPTSESTAARVSLASWVFFSHNIICLLYKEKLNNLNGIPYIFNPFPNKPWFLHVCSTSHLETVRKRKIAYNKQFLLSPQCFLPVLRAVCHFHKI